MFLTTEPNSLYIPLPHHHHPSFLLPDVLNDTERMLGVAESVWVEARLLQLHVLGFSQ